MTTKQLFGSAVFFAILFYVSQANAAENYKFDFGDGPVANSYTQVKANTKFSESLGYGFESGTVKSVDRLWDDELITDFLTASDEMVFSVVLPQGNYEVTFIFGDGENESETTVKAENRKLIFDRVTTSGAVFSKQSVSLRRMETKSMDGSVTMSIKEREKGYYTWDNKLTFTISGKAPAVAGIEIQKKEDVTTLWLCGNSTVVDQMTAPWAGWGQMAPGFFKSSVAIANYAESGLTAKGFMSMKRLDKILADAKKGDYVFVQFAHNDQKNATDVADYEKTLTSYYDKIKAKGAIPVFVTSTARQGELDSLTSVGGLPERMRVLAKKLGVICLDLNRRSIELQKALGSEKYQLYMHTASDKTHFCEYGGYELARAMLLEISEKIPALRAHFRDDYQALNTGAPDPVNVLSLAKTPITEGGLINGEISAEDSLEIAKKDSAFVDSCLNVGCLDYEMENGIFNNAVFENKHLGFSENAYVNVDNQVGSSVTIKVFSEISGTRKAKLTFANGSSDNRPMSVTINGETALENVDFESTVDWENWTEKELEFQLEKGLNTITFTSLSENGGPNLDVLKLNAVQKTEEGGTSAFYKTDLSIPDLMNQKNSRITITNSLGKVVPRITSKGVYFIKLKTKNLTKIYSINVN